jgi:hypothetical protein
VLPVVGLKEHSGMLVITKNGHCTKLAIVVARKVETAYLRMVESNILVDWLSESIGSRKSVVACKKIPYRL